MSAVDPQASDNAQRLNEDALKGRQPDPGLPVKWLCKRDGLIDGMAPNEQASGFAEKGEALPRIARPKRARNGSLSNIHQTNNRSGVQVPGYSSIHHCPKKGHREEQIKQQSLLVHDFQGGECWP